MTEWGGRLAGRPVVGKAGSRPPGGAERFLNPQIGKPQAGYAAG